MNKNFLIIILLLCGLIIFSVFLNPYSRANASNEPVVIRKKIPGQKVAALKPKSDISVITKISNQKDTEAADMKYSRQVPPVYDPGDKIDPFEPLFKETPELKSKSPEYADTERKGTTALERIDLSQLKVTGVILAASGNKALVREASGRGHVISEGTAIGTHGGRVAGILKDKVIVKERMKDVRGRFFFQETELKLNKPRI